MISRIGNNSGFTPTPESHVPALPAGRREVVDEWLSVQGFAPRRNPVKEEGTAVKPWSFTPLEIKASLRPRLHRGLSLTGFTLIELMVTVAILSIGLILVLQSFGSSLAAIKTSYNHLLVDQLLAEKLWEFQEQERLNDGIDASSSSGTFEVADGFSWSASVQEVEDNKKLNKMTISVGWFERDIQKQKTISTYVLAQEKKED